MKYSTHPLCGCTDPPPCARAEPTVTVTHLTPVALLKITAAIRASCFTYSTSNSTFQRAICYAGSIRW